MSSSLYINSSRKVSSRKKGKYCMKEYRALKAAHGSAVAKQLRDAKKQAESQKADGDDTIYWMAHPDFPDKEDRYLVEI